MKTGNSMLQTLMLLIASALLAGCGALIAGGAPTGGHDASAQRSTSIETSHDTAITSSINSRYIKAHLVDAQSIRVTTYQGVVTLEGSVRTRAAATRAVDLARSTPNVRRVVSRLTVTP